MAGQADGSIIVDTELNSDGFKAGSAELLAAIKALSSEVKTLGQTLKETFGGSDKNVGATDGKVQALEATIASLQAQVQSLQTTVTELQEKLDSLNSGQATETPVDGIATAAQGADEKVTALEAKIKELEGVIASMQAQLAAAASAPADVDFDTDAAEAKIAALEDKVSELENTIAQLESGGGGTATPTVNFGGATEKASSLQRQIDSVNSSVERLEPTFQRAMGGSESAMTSFEAKAGSLESKIADLQSKLAAAGQVKMPTAEYQSVSAEVTKTAQKFDALLARQEKMQAMGVQENSKQWKSLQYDMEVVSNKYHELLALKQQLETSGGAFVMGSETAQYAQMEASLAAANQRLAEMRAGLSQSEGFMSRVASGARSVFSWIGKAASTIGGAMLSGLKAAAKGLAKMVTNSKALKSPFDGLTRSLSRLAPALLMARGLMGILRKAVNAYMQENQQLASQLNACWSGIGNILGPIISRLISLVATAVAYVTQFLQLLGFVGKSTSKAIKSAGGGASKEADKLKRQLASFDELNILSDDSSDSGGGGGADDTAAELPEVEMPDWVQLMVDQLKSGQWAAAAKTLTAQLNNMVASVDWAGVGSNIAYWVDGALTFLATAITTFDWYNLGASLGTMINNLIYGVDWGNLGIVLGAKFIALIEGLGGLFATLDWVALGKALADGIMGLWNSIDWVQAASTLSTGIIGALNALSSAIKNVDWQKLGKDIATFIANIDYSGIFTALSDGIGAALGGLAAFVWGLIQDAWASVVEWWYDVAYDDGGFTMEGLLQGIWDGICNIGQWIVDNIFTPFINGFKAAFGIASPSTIMAEQGDFIIQGLLQGITNAWSTITSFFSNALSSITSAISTCWSNIKAGASKAWSGIKTTISNAWSGIKTGATNAYTAVKNGVSSAWSSIKSTTSSVWSGVKSTLSSTWSSIKSTASSTWSSLKTSVSNGWNNIKSNTSSAWSSVKSTLSSTWSSVKSTASSTWSSMKSAASSAWSSMKSTASSTWSSVKSTLSSTWSSIKSTASSTWSSMKSSASSTWTSIKSTASSTWSSIKSSLSSTWSSIKSTASTTWSSIKSTIQNQGWSGVGSNISSGIKNGISNGWSTLTSWVKQKAKSLLDAAKSALGIHSPSRLFRDQVGLNIGLGIGEGVDDSAPAVLSSVTGVADAIAEEFNAGEYEASNIIPTTEVNGALASFSDKISSSFTSLLDRLQAIAENVTFTTPAVANGVVPYRVTPTGTAGGDNVSSTIEASNDELASVVTQVVTNATASIVAAIQQYSGTTVNFDKNSMAEAVIREINRRTRMAGKSPLVD